MSSGARIGHTANTIRYETTENYELIAIQTGDNNYDPNIDISTFSNASQTDREQHDETTNFIVQQDAELNNLEEVINDPIHDHNTILIIEPL